MRKTRVGIQHLVAELSLHNCRCAHCQCGLRTENLAEEHDSRLQPAIANKEAPPNALNVLEQHVLMCCSSFIHEEEDLAGVWRVD